MIHKRVMKSMVSSETLAKDVSTPHSHDILKGRGNGVQMHEGNVHFRELVKGYKIDYVTAPRTEKMRFCNLIYDEIKSRDPPGRFLSQDNKSKLWNEIPKKKSLEKIGQALRERATDVMEALQIENRINESLTTHPTKFSKTEDFPSPVSVSTKIPFTPSPRQYMLSRQSGSRYLSTELEPPLIEHQQFPNLQIRNLPIPTYNIEREQAGLDPKNNNVGKMPQNTHSDLRSSFKRQPARRTLSEHFPENGNHAQITLHDQHWRQKSLPRNLKRQESLKFEEVMSVLNDTSESLEPMSVESITSKEKSPQPSNGKSSYTSFGSTVGSFEIENFSEMKSDSMKDIFKSSESTVPKMQIQIQTPTEKPVRAPSIFIQSPNSSIRKSIVIPNMHMHQQNHNKSCGHIPCYTPDWKTMALQRNKSSSAGGGNGVGHRPRSMERQKSLKLDDLEELKFSFNESELSMEFNSGMSITPSGEFNSGSSSCMSFAPSGLSEMLDEKITSVDSI